MACSIAVSWGEPKPRQPETLTPEKKRTRGSKTTGPVAAIDVWVFGGGEQPLKRIKVYGVAADLCLRHPNHTLRSASASTLFLRSDLPVAVEAAKYAG